MSSDSAMFRKVMARFATGVTVVTVRVGERIHGMTVNSLTSVSLEPPLVLWCAAEGTRTLELIEESRVYAVNFLTVEQKGISVRFARPRREGEDRFQNLEYRPGSATGCPLFPGCLATMECSLVESIPAGDHRILLARPVAMEMGREGARPLLFYGSSYRDPDGWTLLEG